MEKCKIGKSSATEDTDEDVELLVIWNYFLCREQKPVISAVECCTTRQLKPSGALEESCFPQEASSRPAFNVQAERAHTHTHTHTHTHAEVLPRDINPAPCRTNWTSCGVKYRKYASQRVHLLRPQHPGCSSTGSEEIIWHASTGVARFRPSQTPCCVLPPAGSPLSLSPSLSPSLSLSRCICEPWHLCQYLLSRRSANAIAPRGDDGGKQAENASPPCGFIAKCLAWRGRARPRFALSWPRLLFSRWEEL